MARKKYPEYILVNQTELEMPMVKAAGFRTLREPAPLKQHKHEGPELTFLSEGEVTWLLENSGELLLSGGNLAITQPGINHCGKWQIIRPCRLFWIILNPDNPESQQHTIFSDSQTRLFYKILETSGNTVINCSKKTVKTFKLLLSAMQTWDAGPEETKNIAELRLRICDTLLAIWNELQKEDCKISETPLLHQINTFLHEHIMDNIGVKDMASHVDMQTSKFSYKFKELTGQTPADYLRRTRCKTAMKLLNEKNLPITDIALNLGFASSQHFARTFKKYTGMSPGAYRKSITGRSTKKS